MESKHDFSVMYLETKEQDKMTKRLQRKDKEKCEGQRSVEACSMDVKSGRFRYLSLSLCVTDLVILSTVNLFHLMARSKMRRDISISISIDIANGCCCFYYYCCLSICID